MSAYGDNIGTAYARQKAFGRQQTGSDITIAGNTLRVIAREITSRDREFLPEGDQNSAFTDLRVYEANPADTDGVRAGQAVEEAGEAYTVLAVPAPMRKQNISHTRLIMAYRTPLASTATDDPDTGKRPLYVPAPSTF